jgi:MFS family permease
LADAPQQATDEQTLKPRGKIRPFASLAYPQYRLMVIGFVVGFIGFQFRQVTNLWLVWRLTENPLYLAGIGAFQFLPMVFFGIVGGAYADAFDRRKLLIVTQSLNLAIAGVLAALVFTNQIAPWHLFLTTFVTGAVNSFEGPARMTVIPRIVPRDLFMNAITINSSARHFAMLFGPVGAGALIAFAGAGWTYAANAVFFIPSIYAFTRLAPMPAEPNLSGRPRMSAGNLLEGFKYVWSTHVIIALILVDLAAMLFGNWRVLLPVFADDVLRVGPTGFGLMLSAPAVGFLIGSGLLLWAGDIRRKGLLVVLTVVGYAAGMALFSISHTFAFSIGLLVIIGGFDGVGAIVRQTVLQLRVPDELRGRATAVLQMSNRGAPSLGFIVLGSMAASLTAPSALLIGSAITMAVAIGVTLLWREVIEYEG